MLQCRCMAEVIASQLCSSIAPPCKLCLLQFITMHLQAEQAGASLCMHEARRGRGA